MGACDISFTIKGKVDKIKIQDEFELQRSKDESENGHQDGYSGDFQTVSKIDFHLSKEFKTRNEAFEYCLNNAKKWETVVAVYYLDNKSQINTLVAGWGAC